MNSLLIVGVIFLVLFAVIMVAVSLGSRLLEVLGRRRVATMLNPGGGEDGQQVETTILVDPQERDALDKFIERHKILDRTQEWIQTSGLGWSATSLLMGTVIAAVVGAFLGWFLHPLGFVLISAALGGFVFGCIPYLIIASKRKKRMSEFEAQLPEALDFLARSMRAGHAFSVSLEMLGAETADPMGQEFRTLFNEQNLGAPLEVALANFAKRVPLLDVKLFVSSVLLQRQTGGNLSEVLQRLANLVRERFRLRGQIKAASAHGRMTRSVLTALPIVMVFALQFVAPGYLPSMLADSDGKWMVLIAILAQVAGYIVMRRITDIEV
ncbi:MAG TPA: type II secretion system F family protein [Bryobacteraceae bacterium]|nr:type II secretion system F family protein [Bryobacteraceae bacterium]